MSSNMSPMVYICCFISTIVLRFLCGVHGSTFYKQQPILATIKIGKGQVYDCVDFYKQPAFIHQSLRNHIPTVNITSLQSQARKLGNLGFKDGCPTETVPILRLSNVQKSPSTNSPGNGKHCTVVVRMEADEGFKFLGAFGKVSVFKPLVYGNEWSLSRMKILNGPDSLEAGCMVNPTLYNDSEAHLYASWTAGPAGSSGCFNLLCPGFVQVSTNVPLGAIPSSYSHIGWEKQSYWSLSIVKSQDDGNWWLKWLSNSDKDETPVGYWPKSLFTSLSEMGSRVEWGGEINNPDSDIPPFMGSGQKAMKDTRQSAFYFDIAAVVDEKLRYDVVPEDTKVYTDCDEYTSIDSGDQGDYWGRLMFYGGPYKEIE